MLQRVPYPFSCVVQNPPRTAKPRPTWAEFPLYCCADATAEPGASSVPVLDPERKEIDPGVPDPLKFSAHIPLAGQAIVEPDAVVRLVVVLAKLESGSCKVGLAALRLDLRNSGLAEDLERPQWNDRDSGSTQGGCPGGHRGRFRTRGRRERGLVVIDERALETEKSIEPVAGEHLPAFAPGIARSERRAGRQIIRAAPVFCLGRPYAGAEIPAGILRQRQRRHRQCGRGDCDQERLFLPSHRPSPFFIF